jgi:hypothetical protein
MLFFLFFLSELILLFFLSRKLVNSLAGIIYKFTRSHKVVVHTLAVIFLPGTIIHELAHLLFAGIMLVPVGEMNVVPEIEGQGVKLGSVQIGRTDPFRRVIIGAAPVLLGILLIFSIFLFVKIGLSPWWQVGLGLYLLFEIGNTMFSSKKDLEGCVLFAILVITLITIISLALYFLTPNIAQNIWVYISNINFDMAINFFKQAGVYLIVPISLDLLVVILSLK